MNQETADQRLVAAKLATERSPDDVAAWIAFSWAHEGLLDYKSMTAAARRAVALAPDNVDAVRQLAYSLVQTGSGWVDFEDKTVLERLLQLAPHDLTALHYLNIHALRGGDYARALKLAETLERVAPGDPLSLHASAVLTVCSATSRGRQGVRAGGEPGARTSRIPFPTAPMRV